MRTFHFRQFKIFIKFQKILWKYILKLIKYMYVLLLNLFIVTWLEILFY